MLFSGSAAAFKELSASTTHSNNNITSGLFPCKWWDFCFLLFRTATNVVFVPQILLIFSSTIGDFNYSETEVLQK